MTNQVKCKAKTPATCRFHGSGSQEYIEMQRKQADRLYSSISTTCAYLWKNNKRHDEYLEEYFRIKEIKDTVEIEYLATPQGSEELDALIKEEKDLNHLMTLQEKKRLAEKRRDDSEKGLVVPQPIVPATCKLFVFPEFIQTENEENKTTWEGNKYTKGLTVSNVKNLLLRDVEQASKLGILPSNIKVDAASKAGSRMPSISLRVQIPNGIAPQQKEVLFKTLSKMGKAYAKAVIETGENGEKTTTKSYDLFINIE